MPDQLETLATGLHRDLGRTFVWDAGLDMALTTFEASETDALVAAAEKHLASTWTSETVRAAPGEILGRVREMGGLRPGQWLMHSSLGVPFLLAAFWPWGGGTPVSLRIQVVGDAAAGPKLRYWFGIGS
jgi:hypothetical protein